MVWASSSTARTPLDADEYGDQQQQRWRHRIGHPQFDRQQQCAGNSVDQNAVARVSQTTITSNGVGTMVVGYRLAQTNNVSGNTTDGAAGSMLTAVRLMT